MKRMTPHLLCLLLLSASSAHAADEGLKPMFNGKNLDGFTQRGGKAEYKFEDGVLIGTAVPKTPNSFLCTNKDYANFVLEYQFKVDPPLNSGVQIRSLSKADYKNGVVHGYQVEIDPSDRAWTAGIYDESRRGWLNNLKENEPARKAFKQSEWNKIRVVCDDDSIKTWLNGVSAADLKDDMTAKGFIAFQVHGIGTDEKKLGKQVRWRNVKFKELP